MTTLTLTVINGPAKGRVVQITTETTVKIGRIRAVDFSVMDPAMSRIHFELRKDGPQWLIRDLDSQNGTFLNEQRIKLHVIRHHDKVLAGDTMFLVSISNDGGPIENPFYSHLQEQSDDSFSLDTVEPDSQIRVD